MSNQFSNFGLMAPQTTNFFSAATGLPNLADQAGFKHGVRSLTPVRVVFVGTGSHNDQYRHNFQADTNQDNINQLDQTAAALRGQGSTISMMSIANVASNILRPSVTVDKQVNIRHGWNVGRFSFYMEYEVTNMDGRIVRYCFIGYTDYAGATTTGSIDENMRLTITNTYSYVINQGVVSHIQAETNLVANELNYSGAQPQNQFLSYAMRQSPNVGDYSIAPADAYATYQRQAAFARTDQYGQPIKNCEALITSQVKSVNSLYNLPGYYLASTINTMSEYNALSESGYDPGFNMNTAEMNNQIRTQLEGAGSNLEGNPFFRLFASNTNILSDATLTWGMITSLIPNAGDVARIFLPPTIRGNQDVASGLENHYSGASSMTTNWDDASYPTQVAVAISQQIRSMMMSEYIQTIRFTATNKVPMDYTQNWMFHIGNYNSAVDNRTAIVFFTQFPDDIAMRRIEAFKTRLGRTLLDSYFHGREIPVTLGISVDVLGDIEISVQIDGDTQRFYRMPMFAQSYVSPILTSSIDHVDQFAQSLIPVVSEVSDILSGPSNQIINY